jgi:predicted dehydrogenase
MKPIKIGILGAGSFARAFIPLFKAHPLVRGVSLAEIVPERLRAEAARAAVTETYGTLDELLASDCDAVAIFTQRWMHAQQAIAALKAGKHVYSAVPAGMSVEELGELVETVKEHGAHLHARGDELLLPLGDLLQGDVEAGEVRPLRLRRGRVPARHVARLLRGLPVQRRPGLEAHRGRPARCSTRPTR